MNQNNPESIESRKITDQEIAAAIAMGLVIAGILYVIWRVVNSSGNSKIAYEAGESIAKSAMSSVDIASMLKS